MVTEACTRLAMDRSDYRFGLPSVSWTVDGFSAQLRDRILS
jgi:hypothetical protein